MFLSFPLCTFQVLNTKLYIEQQLSWCWLLIRFVSSRSRSRTLCVIFLNWAKQKIQSIGLESPFTENFLFWFAELDSGKQLPETLENNWNEKKDYLLFFPSVWTFCSCVDGLNQVVLSHVEMFKLRLSKT